ncbi:hypothetical protein DM01DRAFT_1341107 [Hesseltinella vesiculosa]|uniref:Uncharacterized protein n=1 Tax=Hesseltinella vesiculosa TaxID=101127 RepID=A0A1X2G202_9FUNG|nr:hypothetical protein DM01DRAFT_1341107 [Hesseltinella vesiculosa]
MGWVTSLKRNYDLHQLNKYTKRRSTQSPFEGRSKAYYDQVYVDGHYKTDQLANAKERQRQSLSSILKFSPSRHTPSLATQQLKTSESYTVQG